MSRKVFRMNEKEYPHHVRDCWEERWLLGAILRYGIEQYRPAAWLEPVDFITRKHQLVWRAIAELVKDTGACDRVSVYRKLEFWNELGEIGHMTGLLNIEPECPEIVNADTLARAIRQERLARTAYDTFARLAGEAELRVERSDALIQMADDRLDGMRALQPASPVETIKQMVASYPGGLEGFLKHSGIMMRTPWDGMNKLTGGLKRGELWVIGARPSMGKTALALNLVLDAARRGHPVAFFSLEMSRELILKRLYSMIAGVNLRDVMVGDLTLADMMHIGNAQEELELLSLRIIDTKIANVADIATVLERGLGDGPFREFDLVVVDYLGLLEQKGSENRNAEVTAISAGLKRIAMQRRIPVVVLSQLNRLVEGRGDKRPQLADLRDSGSVEQDADVVAFLYREGYYNRTDPAVEYSAELNILKNRNGSTASIQLHFDRRYGTFADLDAGYIGKGVA